jgi:hypothetical protein
MSDFSAGKFEEGPGEFSPNNARFFLSKMFFAFSLDILQIYPFITLFLVCVAPTLTP